MMCGVQRQSGVSWYVPFLSASTGCAHPMPCPLSKELQSSGANPRPGPCGVTTPSPSANTSWHLVSQSPLREAYAARNDTSAHHPGLWPCPTEGQGCVPSCPEEQLAPGISFPPLTKKSDWVKGSSPQAFLLLGNQSERRTGKVTGLLGSVMPPEGTMECWGLLKRGQTGLEADRLNSLQQGFRGSLGLEVLHCSHPVVKSEEERQ